MYPVTGAVQRQVRYGLLSLDIRRTHLRAIGLTLLVLFLQSIGVMRTYVQFCERLKSRNTLSRKVVYSFALAKESSHMA